MESVRPTSVRDLADTIEWARGNARRLAIHGGGSKDGIGAPHDDAVTLEMSGFAGIIDYDPAELVLTAGAATPLHEVEALVARAGQMLAFEPFDHGPIFGRPAGQATVGGVVAAGVAGSQRLALGGARDHLLGFEAVSGRGDRFVAGAKVVKNVTGYDLPKLAAGSWGRLFAMTQLTLKVLPAPRERQSVIVTGLDFPTAQRAMSVALGSQAEVAAAAHLPARHGVSSRTILRVQGFGPSVIARAAMLKSLLGRFGPIEVAANEDAHQTWDALRTLGPPGTGRPLWRINVAPSRAPSLVVALSGDWIADWGGGLIWLVSDLEAEHIRDTAARAGGHAMLIRAPQAMRQTVSALHPPAPGIAALEARIRLAFDPDSVFACGRFPDNPP